MFAEFGLFRAGSLVRFPRGSGGGSEAAGAGVGAGETPSLLIPRRPGLTDRLSGGVQPSSRSRRAERWRRRKRRRRRCSQHGQGPCQEKTTSQLSPSIPAAVRTVTVPSALLPPLSPHLGPIVWLSAPGGGGGGKDAEAAAKARERKRKTEANEGGRSGTGGGRGGEEREGSPALRGL